MPLERRHRVATVGGSVLATLFAVGVASVPAVGSTVAPAFDWSAWGMQAVSALLPLFTIVVTYYSRVAASDRIPKAALPVLGVLAATIGDQLASYVSSHVAQPVLAAALGAVGTLLYVIAKEFVGDGA